MKSCRFILSLFILLSLPFNLMANTSSDEDKESLELTSYGYNKGYEFSLKLQELVRRRDLKTLYSLVQKKGLKNGPRKSYALKMGFDAVFSEDMLDRILNEPVDRGPVGWRGYMLGRGAIWHDGEQITSINSPLVEPIDPTTPKEWHYRNRIFPAECFTLPWRSSDNIDEFADRVPADQRINFYDNPGLYVGRDMKDLAPIPYPWSDDPNNPKLAFVRTAKTCGTKGEHLVGTGAVIAVPHANIKASHAQLLAPFLKGKCKEAYLMGLSDDDYSGTLGANTDWAIFGLFDIEGHGDMIVPLKYFPSHGNALDFVDSLSK